MLRSMQQKNAQLNWARRTKQLFCEPTHETRPGKQSFALPRQTSSLVSNVNYGTLQRIPAHTRHFSLHGSLGCKDEATTVSLECTADTECKSGELCIAGKCVSETTCDAAETLCGTSCCTTGETCNNGVCEPAPEQCNAPKTRCGTDCCSETQECIGGACVDRCETVRCGDTQTCCGSGESCLTSGICCAPEQGWRCLLRRWRNM